jgi:predicted RNase H-like HicB family nuclease
MKTIKMYIDWCEKNYGATVDEQVPGAVIATHKTLEGVKKSIVSALDFHVEGMLEDGDDVPEWLAKKEYSIEWVFTTSALLHSCEQYTTIAAIARASGINQRLLSHYANGIKKPRPQQRQRIVDGLHKIGQSFLSVV